MVDRRAKIIADLEKGLDASMALFKSFKPTELNVQVYAEAPAWTVKQVLAHFITWAYEHVSLHEKDIRKALKIE